jgi:Holliday junction resolvase RusA-like endonuclease
LIIFNFPIDPVAKGRPRFTKQGRAFTPPRTKKFEDAIKKMARDQYKNGPMAGSLSMHIVFYIKKPKSTKLEYPINRNPGDIDNLVKNIADSLNGIAYVDDSQIVDLSAHKRYSDQPMIIVTIGSHIDGITKMTF